MFDDFHLRHVQKEIHQIITIVIALMVGDLFKANDAELEGQEFEGRLRIPGWNRYQ